MGVFRWNWENTILRQLENGDACKVLVKQKQFEIASNKVISKYFFKPMFPMFYSLTFRFYDPINSRPSTNKMDVYFINKGRRRADEHSQKPDDF